MNSDKMFQLIEKHTWRSKKKLLGPNGPFIPAIPTVPALTREWPPQLYVKRALDQVLLMVHMRFGDHCSPEEYAEICATALRQLLICYCAICPQKRAQDMDLWRAKLDDTLYSMTQEMRGSRCGDAEYIIKSLFTLGTRFEVSTGSGKDFVDKHDRRRQLVRCMTHVLYLYDSNLLW